jgi:hypothetical protein
MPQKIVPVMDIDDVLKKLMTSLPEYDITLFPQANLQELAEFEDLLQCPLPEDIKTLYLFCNGFESAEDIFRIIPLQEISDRLSECRPNCFYFAEYMTYCDKWEIEINPLNPNDYWIFNRGQAYRLLTKSLAHFLDRFLVGGVFGEGGLYDWHEEVDGQNVSD